MVTLDYTSPDGKEFDLTKTNGDTVVLHAGITGLIPHPQAQSTTNIGWIGRQVSNYTTPECPGTLTIFAESTHMETLYPQIRAAFYPDRPGTLGLTINGTRFETNVCLADAMKFPEQDPADENQLVLEIPLVLDDGVWWGTLQTTNTITNTGDVETHPDIHWGPGDAYITLPSRAVLHLPTATGPRTLKTDPNDAFVVLTPDGTKDEELTEKITALPEPCPKRDTRTYDAPQSAHITWRAGWWDPFRAVGSQ